LSHSPGSRARGGVTAAVAVLVPFLGSASVAGQAQPPSEPPAEWTATAIDYSNVPYPYPVEYLDVHLFGEDHRMAYMDVAPVGTPNGQTVVLFHGMNFFGAPYEPIIDALSEAGFRTLTIDRLGYGRSSKPLIHYNLHIPARNTKALLDELGIERAAIVGHSMGGMVATRFASTYPETTSHVVMVNQIGLTDTRAGRAWPDPEQAYQSALATTYQSVLRGHVRYYPRGWKPEYLQWVQVQYGLTLSGDWPRMARVRAGQRMILYEDPVVHEWQYIASKALVVGGAEDRLVVDYPGLARNVAERLQNAELIIYPGVGHSPHLDNPEQFHPDLIRFLLSDPDEPADQSWRQTDVGRSEGALGTRAQRDALVDSILEMTRRREAWSPFKESAMRYDPLAEMEAVRGEVVNASTEEELYYALTKLSNARRDSHLYLTPVPDGLSGPRLPEVRAPIQVLPDYSDMDAPGFFVSGVDDRALSGSDLPGAGRVRIGDALVTINGRSIPEFVETFRAWTRHSAPQGLFWRLARDVPIRAPATAPWMYGETLDLELEDAAGVRYRASLPYLEPEAIELELGESELYPGFSTVMERFNFNVLRPDDGRAVVLLQWLDFEYELIQDIVDLMEYAEAEGILEHMLVLDVTASSGGSRGAYAIQRLVDKPFRTTYGNLRVSDAAEEMIEAWAAEEDLDVPEIFGLNESRSWLHEWARTDAREAVRRGDAYTEATPFKLAHLPAGSDGILQPAPVHFSGPIAIIGGPNGGSHLDQFVSMFADNDLAFTIGMPTGGYSNTWEAEETLYFPGTDQPIVQFMWNVGHTLRPNGEILEGNAVEPEVYVPLTRENFRTYHRDLLDAALRRLAGIIS
jgi:pimeloyl-ACP methyl ester carboxylesterase